MMYYSSFALSQLIFEYDVSCVYNMVYYAYVICILCVYNIVYYACIVWCYVYKICIISYACMMLDPGEIRRGIWNRGFGGACKIRRWMC